MSVHISVYIVYTVCNRRYTGRYVEGVYTEFFSCGRIRYMSVHISVYIMYTACNRRNTGRHVEGVYKEFYSCGRLPIAQNAIVFRDMYLQFSNYLRAALQFACLELVGCDW